MSITYSPHHPWYYLQGGEILMPKTICCNVKTAEYKGYRTDKILKISSQAEPIRSEKLRLMRESIIETLKQDLNCYRERASELRNFRNLKNPKDWQSICQDIHVNISLKHSHLFNDFAHLFLIDECLSKQPDLFG